MTPSKREFHLKLIIATGSIWGPKETFVSNWSFSDSKIGNRPCAQMGRLKTIPCGNFCFSHIPGLEMVQKSTKKRRRARSREITQRRYSVFPRDLNKCADFGRVKRRPYFLTKPHNGHILEYRVGMCQRLEITLYPYR